MRRISKKRTLRYGSVSLLLCVLAVACVVIVNVIAGALCLRYDWMYIEPPLPAVYGISDPLEDYIEKYIVPRVEEQGGESVKIVFCDSYENIVSEDMLGDVYESFEEVGRIFDGLIEIEHLNIFEKPSLAAEYGVGSTEDIVFLFNGKTEIMNFRDLYIYEVQNYQSVAVAYNGEKLLASCLMRVTQSNTPMCYLTVNHGEVYADLELVRMISEAGYTVGSIDLYSEDIPADCEILVTFNPKKDLSVSGDASDISEVEKLDEYMAFGGRYMVFVSADTFASGGFDNLESFLSDWGIRYMHKTTDDGIEACYLVKDSANSLTVDGYTVLARVAENGITAGFAKVSNLPNSFGKTTYMAVSDGYTSHGPIYMSNDRKRSISPLFLAQSTAVAWADGRAVARASEEDFILMSLSEQACDNGKTSYLLASASVDFASESSMQSSVLGNSRTLTEIVRYMGKDDAPSDISFKPFGQTEIQSLTSRTANILTVALILLPALAMSVLGIFVLIRRRGR